MRLDYDLLRNVLEIIGSATAVVAGTAALHLLSEQVSRGAIDRQKLGWALVMFILALNTTMVALSLHKLDDLHTAQRVHAHFSNGPEDYSLMRDAIEQAKPGGTIYAVNSFEIPYRGVAPHDSKDMPTAEDARKGYYKAINEKMGQVNYHRILQVHDTNDPKIGDLVDSVYLQHFKDMLALENGNKSVQTRLWIAPTRYSMSFVIVENPGGDSYLIWQVDKHLEEGGYKAAGHMIVEDPDQVIIRDFKVLYNTLEQESRHARPSDLSFGISPRQPTVHRPAPVATK
jgi:hypothetical protein